MSELAFARGAARPARSKTRLRAWAPLGVALCVALVACGQQPQKIEVQPTPSKASAAATPTGLVPKYTSKKKLTPAEKKAAEDALVVVVKYEKVVDDAYASSGAGMARARAFTSNYQYKTLLEDAKTMREQKIKITGSLANYGTHVEKVKLGSAKSDEVHIGGCLPYSKTKRTSSDKKADKSWGAKDSPVTYYLIRNGDSWVVDDMSVGAGKC